MPFSAASTLLSYLPGELLPSLHEAANVSAKRYAVQGLGIHTPNKSVHQYVKALSNGGTVLERVAAWSSESGRDSGDDQTSSSSSECDHSTPKQRG